MRLRTNNRFRGMRNSGFRRGKPLYANCQYIKVSKNHHIRLLSDAEIDEFRRGIQQVIAGNMPKAKPL